MAQKLELVWTAKFNDGKVIRQFDDTEQTSEHLFKELQEYPAKLCIFQLENIHTNRIYQADLEAGKITIFPSPAVYMTPEAEAQGDTTQTYRLIYFRRVRHKVEYAGGNLKDGGIESIYYFIGFQYTDATGQNVKRMIQISDQDEVCIV